MSKTLAELDVGDEVAVLRSRWSHRVTDAIKTSVLRTTKTTIKVVAYPEWAFMRSTGHLRGGDSCSPWAEPWDKDLHPTMIEELNREKKKNTLLRKIRDFDFSKLDVEKLKAVSDFLGGLVGKS